MSLFNIVYQSAPDMTFRARFQYFLWGALACLMFCCLALLQFYFIFQPHYLFNCFQKGTPGDICTPPLSVGILWNGDKSIQRVSIILGQRETRVITCRAAVQQRVKQLSWILTITPFIRGTCFLIPFPSKAEQTLSLSGCESTCQ